MSNACGPYRRRRFGNEHPGFWRQHLCDTPTPTQKLQTSPQTKVQVHLDITFKVRHGNEGFVGTVLHSWVVQPDSFSNCDPSSSWERKCTAADREPVLMVPVRFGRNGQKLFCVLLKFWHVGVDLAGSSLPVNISNAAEPSTFIGGRGLANLHIKRREKHRHLSSFRPPAHPYAEPPSPPTAQYIIALVKIRIRQPGRTYKFLEVYRL